MEGLQLETPLGELEWIAPARQRQLERFGWRTVGDVLGHFPKRYEDRTRFDRFPSGESGEAICVCGTVKQTSLRRFRGSQRMFDAILEEDDAHALSVPLVCRWFNAYWVEKAIIQGQRLVVYGKPKVSGGSVVISHPEFEVVVEEAEGSIHLQRIVPIHRATEGLTPRMIRQLVWDLLEKVNGQSEEALLPGSLDATSRMWALRQIHFPDSGESLEVARRHLVLTEFFAMQVGIAAKRVEQTGQGGEVHFVGRKLVDRLHAGLPFELTGAQVRSIGEIGDDLALARPMNRLLHGDVGSGKTLVALSAMLMAVEAGYQAALMAPTQILAEQHYLTMRRLCEPLGVRVGLRTASRSEESGEVGMGGLFGVEEEGGKEKAPDILVGTHALLYEGVGFERLGLAVIDEQHKFGVMQRARLKAQGVTPDILVMTATPIPRTLTMTLYGDLDVSTLDELPKNRGKIVTAARDVAKLPEAVKFLREHLGAGRQAYIVYPLIDESEKMEVKAAGVEFKKWQELLKPMSCGLLHGRIGPEEKETIMEGFRLGTTQVLVATTVIEVGIDVPNANLMLIENAERFGLAQLHQLRGRVGRGEHKSYCVLLHSGKVTEEGLEKLRILEGTGDGFKIAEADLRRRGPGDILGTAQSGLAPLKLGDLFADDDLMRLARNAAFLLFERDPKLEALENLKYRKILEEAQKFMLSQVS